MGRLLSQTGTGFTLFYAPIFFVNQVGLSATQVGIGIGSASITGVLGRALGGSLSDSPRWGRRTTLLLSAVLSAIASFILAASNDFWVFVLGNLMMGLGIGLYWPATEALVADLVTTPAQRSEAFAITRLSDSLGLGLGVVLGGLLIKTTGAYRSLFVIDGISFLVLFVVVYWAVTEVARSTSDEHAGLQGWKQALRDRRLLVYSVVNTLFTIYLVQVSSTMPLYFTNFVPGGLAPETISALFTWHLVLSVLVQMPIVRVLNRVSRADALILSAALWGIGFVLVWLTGVAPVAHLLWAVLALAVLALATATYMPSASSITVEMAPDSLRGVYLAVNSQCWAIGYFVGPPVGGWALDQSPAIAHGFWLVTALSVLGAAAILRVLKRLMQEDRVAG